MTGKRVFIVAALAIGLAALLWADEEPGLLISSVIEDSPAEKAGLIRGDVLLAIDGKEVETVLELREILSEYKAGQRAALTILRGGSERKVTVTLEERLYRPALGFEFADSFGFPRMRFFGGGRFSAGVIILDVVEDSPADRAGLKPRDAILTVDGERVPPMEFAEIIANHSPGDRITLEVSREDGDEPFEVTVRLGENDDGGGLLGVRYAFPGMGFEIGPEIREHLEDFERGLRGHHDDERRGKDRFEFPMEDKTEI